MAANSSLVIVVADAISDSRLQETRTLTVGDSANFDLWAFLHCAALHIFRLALLAPRDRIGMLSSKNENISCTEAVPGSIYASPIRDGIGELLFDTLDHFVQDREHFLGGVPSQPHVQHESLGRLGETELELFDETRLLVGRHGCVRRRVTLEPGVNLVKSRPARQLVSRRTGPASRRGSPLSHTCPPEAGCLST